ncbi:hypothetical protein OMCYN_01673 [cyanobiont of Ornithocercus magnificus]|nr:hypothetical protein OMCYN_01673 [cyanobiont of Ornithocercus magnificus]
MATEKATAFIGLRLTKAERDKLQRFAENRGWTMTRVVSALIQQLPDEEERDPLAFMAPHLSGDGSKQ